MTWKKHFVAAPTKAQYTQLAATYSSDSPNPLNDKYSSWLPEYYAGQPNRIERYNQYDNMDMDVEVNSALDTISDSCVEMDNRTNLPFHIQYQEGVSGEDVELVKEALRQWCEVNTFNKTAWRLFRNVIKYGDQVLIRDPQTYRLYWVDQNKVEGVAVDEAQGKEPTEYVIRDIDPNIRTLIATSQNRNPADQRGYSSGPLASGQHGGGSLPSGGTVGGQQYNTSKTGNTINQSHTHHVDASNVVHLSLSEGMDSVWPFGVSILENVFKTFKQKELIEDAVIIYRVQRAPERRVFYVDTGKLPAHKSMAYLERIKNEIQQKRIPSRTGGGTSILDATYNPMCLTFDTRIPLLDGRTLALSDIIEEYRQGKENWVYSCDEITGKIKPGNITWAGETRKQAETIRLTFDNGKTLTCTPDHKIPVLGKGFVEAQHLTEDDSLISFETRDKSLGNKGRNYQQVFDHELNEWVFTHRMVGEFFKDRGKYQTFVFDPLLTEWEKNTVHHKDYDRFNNDPRNLQWMNFEDHLRYHSCVKREYWEKLKTHEAREIKEKIRQGLEHYRRNNPDWKIAHYDNHGEKIAHSLKNRTEIEKQNQYKNIGKGRRLYLTNNPDAKAEFINSGKRVLGENRAQNQRFVFSQDMLSRFVYLVKKYNANRLQSIELANNDKKLLTMLKEANPVKENSTYNVDNEKFTGSKLKRMYETFGFKNWKDFKNKVEVYNHRVVSIEKGTTQDVGTITVDFQERWHNHHTFAIESGIFVKNSMLEDYFFAQNAEGKGSRVETLPGGDQLGQIDDLRYFNHMLRTGLRVPRSYMPSFDDGGGALFNDGRIGTAYIEELRFTKYCIRLQNLVVDPLDLEFKLFCRHRGINIHESLFKLMFNTPTNFSKYRQTEVDGAVLEVYSRASDITHLSRQFALKRFLGLSEEDIKENERLYAEENSEKLKKAGAGEVTGSGDEGSGFGDLGGAGSSGGSVGDAGLDLDLDLDNEADIGDDSSVGKDSPISGDEGGDDESL